MTKKFLQNLGLIVALAFGAFGAPISPVSAQVEEQEILGALPTDRIIVKYKDGSAASASPAGSTQVSRLAGQSGVDIQYVRPMSEEDSHVMQLPEPLPMEEVQVIANQLMTLPEVEYAEPDIIMQHTLTVDDPEFTNQWSLYDTWGINAEAAWDIEFGETNIVIAVLDTGITEDHGDIIGRTVSGYDFISNIATANDGDGRDPYPWDPGDWVSANECFGGSLAMDSSWHGTHVAGTIGAFSNNSAGIAGINWDSKILPVRVLGKCGGYVSDIADAMRWSAGLSVSGVPANTNPAHVLNLSLGGVSATCLSTYQNAINDVIATGATVVVAAGNEYGNVSNFTPANCTGVITVAATNRNGDKAFYSNSGVAVEISAPGGEGIGSDSIISTSNPGTTTPEPSPDGDIYEGKSGTSMAAPHVTGVVSLMYSVNPGITPEQVLEILQATATPFSVTSTCTTAICGAGIVNAAAAVAAAEKPDVIIISAELVDPNTGLPLTGNPVANETFGVRVTPKNRGGSDTPGVFYNSVYVDRNPSTYTITSPEGCLYNSGIDDNDWGDYRKENFIQGIPSGGTDPTIVEITDGLPPGTYQFWFYVDPTCLVEGEAFENNNAFGPIEITVGPYNNDTVGVFRPSNGALYLKNYNTTGFADLYLTYGLPGDYPIVGDWNGDGIDTIGIYRNGIFYLRNSNTNGFADILVPFGAPGDQPIVGDWNGDGIDTIGVYRRSTGAFYLRNSNTNGSVDATFTLGIPGDIGIAGDWNGDGVVTTGVFRPSNGALYLKNTNATGFADLVLTYGLPGDLPVTGDWNGNGIDTIGIYRNGFFYLRNSNTNGFADIILELGISGDMPIAGDWDGLP